MSTHEKEQRLPILELFIFSLLGILVRGPLVSAERMHEIWKLNTGHYDYLVKSFSVNQLN
jgi:hypothetical protein